MAEPFDLLILGSGSTAFAAAIRATDLGARVAMVERRTLGGTCANRGCLPSKNLIDSPAHIGVDFGSLVTQKDEVVHAYRAWRTCRT